jgi:decaprenylphospho-beta-D-erythro-pentofuranosid-2-ulose 2-reductase
MASERATAAQVPCAAASETNRNASGTINQRATGLASERATAAQVPCAAASEAEEEVAVQDALGAVQSVLVLGGGSDIALATCRALVGRRARTVVLAARRPATLDTAVKELEEAGATTVEAVGFDATATDTHEAFVADMFDRFGDFDLVLLAFGVLGDQERAEQESAAAVEIARVNYVGAVSVAVPVAQRLRTQGHGTLVVLSSVAGERARRSNFVYGSTKAGMDAFCEGLDASLAGSGARVMIVRPGFVHTKMTQGREPAPLSTTPDAVAAGIVNGLARRSHTVWVPPTLRWVMTVLRHLPRAVFRRLPL